MNIPVVALKGLNVFPGMVIHFDLQRQKSIAAVKTAMRGDGKIFTITQKSMSIDNPARDDLYDIGTIVYVRQITKLPGDVIRVLVEGINRGRLESIDTKKKRYILGEITEIEEDNGNISDDSSYEEAAFRTLLEMLSGYMVYHPKVSQSLSTQIDSSMKLSDIVNRIAMNIPIPYDKKQMILEGISTADRYELLSKILCEETNIAQIHEKLSQDIKEKVSKNQREYILKEQMAYIRKELSDGAELTDSERYMKQLEELDASDEIKEKIKKEIRRFEKMPDSGSEGSVQRSYIETLLEMPWNHKSVDDNDIKRAEDILNADHFGMDKVKESHVRH